MNNQEHVRTNKNNKITNVEQFVLQQLEAKPEKWISGGKLALQANVSRNTIWRAIKKLQNAGYSIESVTGRGYRLKSDFDQLSEYGIKINLNNPNRYKIELFDTVDSTNNILKEKSRAGAPSGTLIIANAQDSGRGRRGRNFFSPPETGIYFSLLIRPDHNFNPGQKSPALAAVALAMAVDKIFGENTGIKWVNDIYLENKKIAGILSEAELDFETGTLAYIVIGIGVNVYQPQNKFPQNIRNSATAILSLEERQSGLRNKLIAEFLNQWEIYADPKNEQETLNIFREKSVLTDKIIDIWHNHKTIQAKVLDINQNFELVIESEDGSSKIINHGEATMHKKE